MKKKKNDEKCKILEIFLQLENMDGNTPLKMHQRNTNYDCSTPISPTTPGPQKYQRNYRGSALFR